MGFDTLTDGRQNILHNYRKARAVFLAGKWDYLLTIESDMVPPVDILEQLLTHHAPVAYSLYVFRGSKKWSAYREFHLGWGASWSEYPEEARAVFGQALPVAGQGLGATLIRRDVLKAIDFRGIHGTACDGWFALDLPTFGFRQVCDTACVSGHLEGDKVLYPSIAHENLYEAREIVWPM